MRHKYNFNASSMLAFMDDDLKLMTAAEENFSKTKGIQVRISHVSIS